MTENCCHQCGSKTCTGEFCVQKVPIFAMLSEEEMTTITLLIKRRRFKKGQIIFYEGDLADKFYILNSGKLKIYKTTREGKEQILYILKEGDFIGDLNLLKKGQFEFNAEAIEEVGVCTLAKDDFDNILRTNPEICIRILETLHDRLISLENLVQTLSTKDVEARIAGLLVSFIDSFGTEEKGQILLDLPLSREDMANFIGVTRETMSRKLTSLQEQKIIELIENRKILIRKLDTLKSLGGID
jgi:CRP/FNR family transcriptional regulator